MLRFALLFRYKYAILSILTQQLTSENALRAIQSGARYLFVADEFAKLTGRLPGSLAVKSALDRLARQGKITHVAKTNGSWLIVPPEYAHFGAPPVDWWLHDFLKSIDPHYYLGLLSAARHWGSAHYAVQTTQVMLGKLRPSLTIGKMNIDFIAKQHLERTPVVTVSTGVAPLRVSTREATLLDLVRHQAAIGGIEAIARIAWDFAPPITSKGLLAALDALDQAPAAQRLGFVLAHLGFVKQAKVVAGWLTQKRTNIARLTLRASQADSLVDPDWKIAYTRDDVARFEEIR